MSGLIGKKLGMTSVFAENGAQVPVTVIEILPNVVTQIKTIAKDGYSAVQVGYEDKKVKSTTKALQGHFAKANTTPKRHLVEFDKFDVENLKLGDEIPLDQVFDDGTVVDIIGTSKGKGFQGVVKRHGFGGVGGRTHGQHNRERAPGSIGNSSDPSRVFKGVRMAGQMGNKRVKVKNVAVVKILKESSVLLVGGPVPGPTGSIVMVVNTDRSI